jgi:hypothetical protein
VQRNTHVPRHQLKAISCPNHPAAGPAKRPKPTPPQPRMVMDFQNPSRSPAAPCPCRLSTTDGVSPFDTPSALAFAGAQSKRSEAARKMLCIRSLTACATLTRSCRRGRNPVHNRTCFRDARAGAARPAARPDGQWRASWRASSPVSPGAPPWLRTGPWCWGWRAPRRWGWCARTPVRRR